MSSTITVSQLEKEISELRKIRYTIGPMSVDIEGLDRVWLFRILELNMDTREEQIKNLKSTCKHTRKHMEVLDYHDYHECMVCSDCGVSKFY